MSKYQIKNVMLLFSLYILFVSFIVGCSQETYEDQKLGVTIKKLGSDLDKRWSLNGVIVETIKPGSIAENSGLRSGELISYIIDERNVDNKGKFSDALADALDDDEKAILRISKTVTVSSLDDLGIQVKPDPEERGLIVASVRPSSKADLSGIMRNSIIYTIDNEPVNNIDQFNVILSQKIQSNGKFTINLARDIVSKSIRKVGIEEENASGGVIVKKLEITESDSSPAIREGIKEGDLITHVIDEIEIKDIKSYKNGMKKASHANRVIFRRGEIGGIKLTIIDALGQIGDSRAIEPLVRLLESNDRWIRRASASALSGMNEPSIIQPLLGHLLEANEPDPEVRRSAAEALAKMKPVEAIEPLALALRDSSLGVRLLAGYALGRIGQQSTDVLVKASQDADGKVRDIAVATLGAIGGKLAKEELKKVLENVNEEPTVKLTAIQALYKIGDADSITHLQKIATSSDPRLGSFVKELLGDKS
jgi:HEAT repeat protein